MTRNRETIREMFQQVSLGAPENAVGFVLWRITARYQRAMDRALQDLGLTHLQFVILALSGWLALAGEPVNQAQIARFGGIHPMQLSQTMKVLENKGYVSRERSLSDARANQIVITAAGLKVLRRALPLALEVQAKLFGEEGRPGESLHRRLLALDRKLAESD